MDKGFYVTTLANSLSRYYQLDGVLTALPGELDDNFKLTSPDGNVFSVKIAHAREEAGHLDMQHAMLLHLASQSTGLLLPQPIPNSQKSYITHVTDPIGRPRLLRVLSWLEGSVMATWKPRSDEMLRSLGKALGRLTLGLHGFDHEAGHRFIKWDLGQTPWVEPHLACILDPEKRALADWAYHLHLSIAEILPGLRKSLIYNDANDYNILLDNNSFHPNVISFIDYGDAVFSYTVNEPAIGCAYAVMTLPDPISGIVEIVKAFHTEFPLQENEIQALFPLIVSRLLISVVNSALNLQQHPENEYLQVSDQDAWDLLFKFRQVSPNLVHYRLREACGLPACPQRALFDEWMATDPHFAAVVESSWLQADIHWLDLGVGSQELGLSRNIFDERLLDYHIRTLLQERAVQLGIGRYDEIRPLYTSDIFSEPGNNGPRWRTIHIGLDLFQPAGSPVFAPLDGVIHSFADNANDRDYGPTIILEHKVTPELTFYTLYGHLSQVSLLGIFAGMSVRRGQQIASTGDMSENGNWSPHLHFQIMLDCLGKSGDFPGVVHYAERNVWTHLCPDPSLFLRRQFLAERLQPTTGIGSTVLKNKGAENDNGDLESLLKSRKRVLGKNLSVSYTQPIKMLRGAGKFLLDHTGRRYLDTVNNVAHVGHEHTKVVLAGQRQMAVLNTNTRYLHDLAVIFAEKLLSTLPSSLEVIFFVNSGSEATELALRLARTFTGSEEMIALETGYHGNTTGAVGVSSYKFDGPGGSGAPACTHVIPMPDTYRALHTDPSQVSRVVERFIGALQYQDKGLAGFIAESILSCGGQVPLPPGYLKVVYEKIKKAGGVCIADEVQTGLGRVGSHYWAFELQAIIPDIVTIGKPLGNGHPVAAVATTRVIADAFANGMEYFNTFGGNPVSAAIGTAVLDVIEEEGLQENAFLVGQYLKECLTELQLDLPIIGDIRGHGLFLGIELVKNPETKTPADKQADHLANRMRQCGVLMSTDGPYHNVLKIKPPMVFSRQDADFLVGTLEKVLRENAFAIV